MKKEFISPSCKLPIRQCYFTVYCIIHIGYIDASNAVQKETGISLDKWQVADNIDLYYILQDYESYY